MTCQSTETSAWPVLLRLARLLVALPLFACATAEKCTMGRVADLPLEVEHHHLVTAVEINHSAARLIVDTGSVGTVLTSDSVTRLHLPAPQWTPVQATGIGGKRDLSVLQTAEFKLGKLNGRDLHFGVLDVQHLLGVDDLDGLLGMDLLSQFDIDLDLPERRLILYQATGGCDKPGAVLDAPMYGLPMLQAGSPWMATVDVTISGVRLRALLDSGADRSSIFRQGTRRLGLDQSALAGDRSFKIGGIGPRGVLAHRHIIEPLTIGDLTIRNMLVDIADERSAGDYDMILGLDFFSRVHVWLSFSSRTVILQFPPRASPPVLATPKPTL